MIERIEFGRVLLQQPGVVRQAFLGVQHHATRDPPLDRRISIPGEIDAGVDAQQGQDLPEIILLQGEHRAGLDGLGRGHIRVPADPGQFAGDLLRGQDKIDTAAAGGALRHAGELGGRLLLREGNAARGLDLLQPLGAVRTGARQDHTDRAVWLSSASDLKKWSTVRC